MNASEINSTKKELIKWISELKDEKFLALIDSFRLSKSNTDWWCELSDAQKQEIEAGLKDVETGKKISSADFWKKHS